MSLSNYVADLCAASLQYRAGFRQLALNPQHFDCVQLAFLRCSNIGGSVLRLVSRKLQRNTAVEGMRSGVSVLLFLCETLWNQWHRLLKESCEVAEIMRQVNQHR
jgi:hypothetical protein